MISLHLNKVDTQTKESLKDEGTGLNTIEDEKVKNISRKQSKVIQGVGKFNNRQIELIVDANVKHVAQRPPKIPFHLRAKIIQS